MNVLFAVLMILGFVFFAALGLPIPFAFLIPTLTGLICTSGLGAMGIAATQAISVTNSFVMLALPMFMLMGELISRSGVADDAFDTLEVWMQRVPGGLIISTVLGSTILSACTGSSIATALTMSKAVVPRLIPRGYDKTLVAGCLGGSSIGLVIPPSAGFIIFGFLTEASIAQLFMAGLTAGLFLEALFISYILVRVALKPSLAPALREQVTWARRIGSLKYFWPFPLIIGGVLGTMYGGVATPVEASALGVVAVMVVAFVRRHLTIKVLKEAFMGTARSASWLLLILFVGLTFGQIITRLGVISALDKFIQTVGIAPWMVIGTMFVLTVFLGCFLDGATILILTAPIFVPIVASLGYDVIWFGLQIMITIEIGLISPPLGITCYVIAEIMQPYDITLEQVFKANFVWIGLMSLGITCIWVFPGIALWLPSTMR